jgi:hypothetical protein
VAAAATNGEGPAASTIDAATSAATTRVRMREDENDEVIPWSGKAREFPVDSSMFSDRVLLERLSEQLVPARIYYAKGSAAKQKRGQTQKRPTRSQV